MYSVGDVVKIVSWKQMKSLAIKSWNCGDYDEKITVCEFEYSFLGSNEGEDICGQIGIITNILEVRGIETYEIKFLSNKLKNYNNYLFEKYLIEPYELQSDIKIIF